MKFLKKPLFWIFLFALLLRIYKLGEFPVGLHVDEIRVGWNSLSILETGRDDHLNLLPLTYDSFGDFRPAGIFYFTIPSLILFGRTIFANRFSVALFGALMVFPIYFLTNNLSDEKTIKKRNKINLGYLSAIIISISPWEIELSRATNEAVISAFFAISAIYFLVKFIKSGKAKYGFASILFITISYLMYHSIRFLAPLFFIFIAVFYIKKIKTKTLKKLVYLNIAATILLTAYFGLAEKGLARFNQTSVFGSIDTSYEIGRLKNEDLSKNALAFIFDNKAIVYSKSIISEYGNYFSPGFLFGYDAKPYRFSTPGTGLITYVEALILLIGIIGIIRGEFSALAFILLVISPIPAALTIDESPNLSRAFLMSPFISIICSFGIYYLIQNLKFFKKQLLILLAILLCINFAYFEWMYFHHSQIHSPYIKDYFPDSPTYRDVGAFELSQEIDSLSSKYEKVIITNFPDSIYPWYAFFTNKDPGVFNETYSQVSTERDWGNIVFSTEKCPSDEDFLKYYNRNILVIDSWECGYESQIKDGLPVKVVDKIKRADGSEVYIFLERDWSKDFPETVLAKIKQTSQK